MNYYQVYKGYFNIKYLLGGLAGMFVARFYFGIDSLVGIVASAVFWPAVLLMAWLLTVLKIIDYVRAMFF